MPEHKKQLYFNLSMAMWGAADKSALTKVTLSMFKLDIEIVVFLKQLVQKANSPVLDLFYSQCVHC